MSSYLFSILSINFIFSGSNSATFLKWRSTYKFNISDVDDKYFSYFTQWDDSIFTKDDNVLEVISSWLFYPIWVNNSWVATIFNTGSFDFTSLEPDFILKNPVKDFDTDFDNNLLNLKIDYYKYFNCYNTDDKIERTFLIKKNF